MNRPKVYLGVDVASRSCEVAIFTTTDVISGLGPNQWKTIKIGHCIEDFRILEQVIRERVDPLRASVAVEASFRFYGAPLIYFLQRLGSTVFAIDPRSAMQARRYLFGIEAESDAIDSKVLAYLLYEVDPKIRTGG